MRIVELLQALLYQISSVQAQNLAANGTRELLLIAQDSTYYGLDLYKKRNLAELLDRLADVEGIDWIRLHYAFPTGFPLDVLDVMRERENICRYLDMPLQHGSTRMLQHMRRGTTRQKQEALIHTIREKIPGIAMRTTLIAGYPGETQEDFDEMLEFVEKMQFERLGIFTYSHEEQTHAFNFPDDVPEEVKQERADIVMDVQAGISLDHMLDNTCLVASREFKEGEIVFTNQANLISKRDFTTKKFILNVEGTYIRLYPEEHFIHRPEYVEALGFDSFMDHSCDPNTSQAYQNSTLYTVRATRTILPGEKITCDYAKLENQAEKIQHVPSTKFVCQCESSLCRGIIVA